MANLTTNEMGANSERTPLLVPDSEGQQFLYQTSDEYARKVAAHQAVYDRFSRPEKHMIVALVAFTGVMPLFVSGSFIPSIPQMAVDLDTTAEVISLAVSISVLASAFGTLFWATYSGFYGRRPIYLIGLPLVAIGSFGVGAAQTVTSLMCWRVVQALGAAGGLSLGAGVIGDIYKLEERGTAMGVFFGAVLLGPASAAVAGGIAAHYSSWRVTQYALAFAGFLMFASMYLWFPETSHPGSRGVDKLKDEPRSKIGRVVLLNPLRGLWLVRSPNLAAVMFAGAMALLADYVLIIPIAATIGKRYNITNEAFIGACYIPLGAGNFIGAPLAGYLSDRLIIKWRARRGGVWVPEDRLRATLIGAFVLVPFSVMLCGWATVFVEGWPGLTLNLVGMFVNGIGVDFVLNPVGSYIVDILHDRSAEVMAVNAAARSFILSVCIPFMLPSVKLLGAGWTNTITAVGAWIGAGLLLLTIQHGETMRNWVDVGFTTSEETN